MKSFSERNPVVIGAIGLCVAGAVVTTAINFQDLPFIDHSTEYSAFFSEAGGLTSGAAVQVSGMKVGQVESVGLSGPQVLVTFKLDEDVRLGDRTEAAVKTKTVLGAKILEVTPRGDGQLTTPIPVDRTRSAYQLPDALGDLTMTISGLNTEDVSKSLATLSETFKDTPPTLKIALQGVSRFSDTLNARDAQLRTLLANANKATTVLAERSDQIVGLITNSNALLTELLEQSSALDHVARSVSALSQQIQGFITENKDTFKPALEKLNGVLTIIDNRKQQVQESIRKLNAYILSLGEAAASGPFFKAYVANLLPGQFMQPFVDAAFSDLGLDPATLLPSQRVDPQTGQPATPALPIPYPRTGQGGPPTLDLPDAITGNPGDPRYPYRPPLPAPPPGGPPPGPPAVPAAPPTPSSVLYPPLEAAPPTQEGGR
ncbi:mammalian cell entry protein [Mycolicibacterium litorale]|nr:mammalian cell entry protein [Mycolicibacterium litorale]